MSKILRRSRINASRKEVDSVKERWSVYGRKMNISLLERFHIAHNNLSKFREDRDRALRYVYGDQWSDRMLYKGRLITEKNYIEIKGNIPLVNNVMRGIVNSVSGIYAKQDTEPVCYARNREDQFAGNMMTTALQCNWQINKMPILLLSVFEEFLLSGAAICRDTYEYREDLLDEYTDACNPYYMAWEAGSDPRGSDIRMIGQMHDLDKNSMIATFCGPNTGITVEELRQMYFGVDGRRIYDDNNYSSEQMNERNKLDSIGFYQPSNRKDYRVFEIWTTEIKERYRCWDTNTGERYKIELDQLGEVMDTNSRRMELAKRNGIPMDEVPLIEYEKFIDKYWYFNFLTPSGHVLMEGETPFEHKSHPYSIKLFPFVNGEVHSFAGNFIDQQRYINRLVTLNDFILRTSAKGVTMVPEDCIPDGMTPEEFAENWTSVDGLVIYKPKPGSNLKPEMYFANSANIGINEMLQLQLQLVDRISTVQGALQGRAPSSGTSAQRYSMESQNSATSLASILKIFTSFTEDVAKKKVKIIQQYYEDGRYISTNSNSNDIIQYKAIKAQDVEYYVSIRESMATPVYRMMANDWLKELWAGSGGLITVQDLLRYGDFPFADKLLKDIEDRQSKLQNGQVPQQIMSEQLSKEIGANQQSVNSAEQMLMGNFNNNLK